MFSFLNHLKDSVKELPGSKLFLAVLLFALLNGCTYSPPLLQPYEFTQKEFKKWESYGAVYEINEIIFHQEEGDYPFHKVYQHYRIRFLTKHGLKHATIPLSAVRGLRSVHIVITHPDSTQTRLGGLAYTSKVAKERQIVLPDLQVGSVAEIKIEKSGGGIMMSSDFYLFAGLPSIQARIALALPRYSRYSTKMYGDWDYKKTYENVGMKSMVLHTWDQDDMLPITQRDLHRFKNSQIPHISYTHWYSEGFGSWSKLSWGDISEGYEKALPLQAKNVTSEDLNKLVLKLCKDDKSQCHEKLLKYIQTEISLIEQPLRKRKSEDILEAKGGNSYEICMLLHDLLVEADYAADIILSRPRDGGGFDSKVPAYSSTVYPLVVAKVNGKDVVFTPYTSAANAGDYYPGLIGEKALSLKAESAIYIPHTSHQAGKTTITTTIDVNDELEEIPWRLQEDKLFFFMYRMRYPNIKDDEIKTIVKSELSEASKDNKLIKIQSHNFNEGKTSFKLDALIESEGLVAERKSAKWISLAPFFTDMYGTTKKLTYPYYNTFYKKEFVNEVKLKNECSNECLEITFACEEMSNDFFKVKCEQEKGTNEITLRRRILMNKSTLTKEEMKRKVLPHINKLPKIRESHVIVNK